MASYAGVDPDNVVYIRVSEVGVKCELGVEVTYSERSHASTRAKQNSGTQSGNMPNNVGLQ